MEGVTFMVFRTSFGGFLKWGYPQIIYFNWIFHYKQSILGYPHLWKPSFYNVEMATKSEEQLYVWSILTYPYHPIYFFNLERPQTFTFDLRYIHAVILLPEKSNIYWPGTRVSKIWWFLYIFMNFGACNSCWSTFDLLFIFVAGYLRLDALKQAIANSPRDHLDQERPWRTSRRSSRWPVIQTHIDIHWHQFFNWYMRI